MARAAVVGDSVLYCNNLGYSTPAIVTSVNGTVVDLHVVDPRQPLQPEIFGVAQDSVSPPTAVGKWNFNTNQTANVSVAGTTGTANGMRGTFVLASGQSAYTLTNSNVSTTSLAFCTKMTAEASSRTILSVVPTANTLTVTLSGTVGSDTTIAYQLLNG